MSTSIRLAVVTADGSPSDPIVVDAPDGTPFAAIRPALDLPYAPTHAGRAIRDDDVLGRAPLVDGALLEPPRRPDEEEHAAILTLVSASGPHQGCALPLAAGHVTLGRHHHLLGDDSLASRRHALVSVARGQVTITDLGSSNGVTSRGARLQPHVGHPWRVGESVRLGASVLRLDLASAEPAPPDLAGSDLSGIKPAETDPMSAAPANAGSALRAGTSNCLPEPRTFEWPAAPTPPRRVPLRWIAVLAPVPVALVLAIVMHAAYMLCFMLVGPLVMVATHLDDRRRGRRGGRSAARDHAREVQDVGRRVADALDAEVVTLLRLAPSPDQLLAVAAGSRDGLGLRRGPSARLLRLGYGDAPSAHRLARNGSARPLGLSEAPVTLVVAPGGLVHLDADAATTPQVLELVVAQLAVLHDPTDAPPVVVTRQAASRRWAWALDSARVHVHTSVPETLLARLDDGVRRPGSDDLPLVVLEAGSADATRLARRLVIAGAAVVWVGAAQPPSIETGVTTLAATVRVTCAAGHRAARLPGGHTFTLDSPGETWFPAVMRLHRRWAAGATGGNSAPLRASTSAALLPSDVAGAWRTPSTNVPIGHDHDGIMTLDLARTGPHALVAGTTGSGKSEFLLTYLRGLFTLNSPEHVNALLIDYKGGATFGPLARAPHVVGVVTDLDHGLATRALTALRAEIGRREHLLGRHGLTSYRDYLAAAPAHLTLPRFFVVVDEFRVLADELPDFVAGLVRLAAVGRSLGMHVILATQRPGGAVSADMRANLDVRVALRVRERSDSIDVIDSPLASRISARTPGRGYLATAGEAPVEFQSAYSGAPRELGTTAAVHVHPTVVTASGLDELRDGCDACRPGRTSARSDLGMFVDEALAAAHQLPPIHRPVLPPLPENVDELLAETKIVVGLDALTGERPTPAPHSNTAVCDRSESLFGASSSSDGHDRAEAADAFATDDGLAHVVGIADLPGAQSQPAVTVPAGVHVGLAGAPRSGRTNAAAALARAAVCGSAAGATTRTASTWWVGPTDPIAADVHVASDDADAVIRLLTHLAEAHPAGPSSVVVIDGWEDLHATLLRINHGLAAEDLLKRISEGHRHGHTFIVTGGRQVLASKLSALLDVRLVLRQNDATEYSLAGLRPAQIPASMPPGRALVLPHGHQVHLRHEPQPNGRATM